MSKPSKRPRTQAPVGPSQELVLATLERAVRHRGAEARSAPTWALLDHLGVPRRSGEARRVRAVLGELRAGGRLERSHPHGVEAWELTDAGRRQLRRARRAGAVPPLPESPQHRDWRNARTTAAHEIDRFRLSLRVRLEDALLALENERAVSSDAWFELADALRRGCRRLGSASYCLYEWPEPHDELADLDSRIDLGDEQLNTGELGCRSARRMGRRNVRLWQQED